MEVKDVKKGKRVKVIADRNGVVPVGAIGTLIESNNSAPYVSFDEHYELCFNKQGFKNVRALCHYELEEI